MKNWTLLLLSPETYWALLLLGFHWLAARNVPATAAGNELLTWAIWLAAGLAVPLSFVVLAVPHGLPWLMLTRLGLSALIGLNTCVIVAGEAIHYPEPGRNSGLLALWLRAGLLGAVLWLLTAGLAWWLLRPRARVQLSSAVA